MLRRILLIALSVGSSLTILAQSTALDLPTLYIVFLTQHAQDAKLRTNGHGGVTAADSASRLHVKPAELQAIDAAAAQFAAQDLALTQEALQKHLTAKAAGASLPQDTVHAFTVRRTGLAAKAFASLQLQLTSESFAGLQAYLQSVFSQSIQVTKPARR